ncbi:unnamed protein product [Rhizoctonia solani]|uniref:Methyltransferase domain-containing protein n=1 Tax=Rhizoctonia solani TaxID=456999 RepID=A0A8H3BLC6_9AGAM|nr:unnamed protein product [Rhizoctonia solani]
MEPVANSSEACIRHGRQFHRTDGNYSLPNDEKEFNRLNDQFQALKLIAGSNYTAPLPQLNSGEGPKDILDIATGSGIWVIELAREFSQARVVGIDLSKPGFFGQGVPQNASFIVADITKRLPFEDASFDVVQMRIVPSITERTSLYQEIHRVLRPGGIIQLVEAHLIASRKGVRPPALKDINKAVARGGFMYQDGNKPPLDENGKPEFWFMASRIAPALRAAPSIWTNVSEKQIRVPVGVWASDEVGQEAGRLMKRQIVEMYKGLRPNVIDVGGMGTDEVDELIARLADELEDGPKWELELPYEFIWAAKA